MAYRFQTSSALVLAMSALACDLDSYTATMRIDHYLEPCEDGADFCLRVIDDSAPPLRPGEIDSFDYQPGYVYELDVLVIGDSVLGDAPRYELLEVVERTPVSPEDRFELTLDARYVVRLDSKRIDLVAGPSVVCSTAVVCDTVAEAMQRNAGFRLTLGHTAGDSRGYVAHDAALMP